MPLLFAWPWEADPVTEATTPCQLAARLAHDVGKYMARTARNVAAEGWTPELVAMLCRDLYPQDRRLSLRFAELARPLQPWQGPTAVLQQVSDLLAEAERREPEVRRAVATDLKRVATIARQVEDLLRGLARQLYQEEKA
jgi:hypothetical protein